MQVSKWGNSLAVRLPQAVVEALQLKEGDQIEISVAGAREFAVDRDRRRERALEIPEQQLEISCWLEVRPRVGQPEGRS